MLASTYYEAFSKWREENEISASLRRDSEFQPQPCETFTAGLKPVQYIVEQITTNVLHSLQIQRAIIR